MTTHGTTLRRFLFSTMLVACPVEAAFAQDAAAVADRLKAALMAQGVNVSWTGVTGDASSMVLQGVSIKPAGEVDALQVGNVTLTGVAEADG